MIIFLYGEDTYRSRQKLRQIKEKFSRDVDPAGLNVVRLEGQNATLERINEAVSPVSLFAKKRLIIVENIFRNPGQAVFSGLLDFLKKKHPESDNILVFWDDYNGDEFMPKNKKELFEFLRGGKYAQNFKILSNTEVADWARRTVEERGGRISRQAAAEMASLLGSDLWRISHEIDKLLAYKRGQQDKIVDGGEPAALETEDLKSMVRGNFDENIFALTDAIGSGQTAKAAALLEEQRSAGLTDGYLLAMIARQFRILLEVKDALEQGNTPRKISSLLKLHPFVVQKGISQSRFFSRAALLSIMNNLIGIEYEIKTGRLIAGAALTLALGQVIAARTGNIKTGRT